MLIEQQHTRGSAVVLNVIAGVRSYCEVAGDTSNNLGTLLPYFVSF